MKSDLATSPPPPPSESSMARHSPAAAQVEELCVLAVVATVVLPWCFDRATVLGCATPGAGIGTRVSRVLLVGYRTSGQDNRCSGSSTISEAWNSRTSAFYLFVEVSWVLSEWRQHAVKSCLSGLPGAQSTLLEDFQFLLPFSVQHQVVHFEPLSECWPGKADQMPP